MTPVSGGLGIEALIVLYFFCSHSHKADVMRKPLLFVLVGIVAGLAIGATGAIASGDSDKPDTESAAGATEALGGASAPTARMSIIVNGNAYVAGPPADFGITRSAGVAAVTNPEAGTFCIRPTAAAVPANQVGKLIPSVTVTFNGTDEYMAFAQYVTPRPPACPLGSIAVYTFTADDTGVVTAPNNDVAFSVVVP